MTAPLDLLFHARTIKADEVVAPDVLYHERETVNRVLEFGEVAKDHPEFKYMAVVQGDRLSAFQRCVDIYMNCDWISTLALPRLMGQLSPNLRITFAEWITDQGIERPIHCLGSTGRLEEVRRLVNYKLIRGIDTAAPIKMGLALRRVKANVEYGVQPHDERYWTAELSANDKRRRIIDANIFTYLEWAEALSC